MSAAARRRLLLLLARPGGGCGGSHPQPLHMTSARDPPSPGCLGNRPLTHAPSLPAPEGRVTTPGTAGGGEGGRGAPWGAGKPSCGAPHLLGTRGAPSPKGTRFPFLALPPPLSSPRNPATFPQLSEEPQGLAGGGGWRTGRLWARPPAPLEEPSLRQPAMGRMDPSNTQWGIRDVAPPAAPGGPCR